MAKEKTETLTIETIRKIGTVTIRKEDSAEMVGVRVVDRTCRSNGKKYGRGDEFEMEISLVPVRVAYGQIEIVKKGDAKK